MKKLTGGLIPFFIIHFFCCGALLFLLISSGILLMLRQEATNKLFLLPVVLGSGFIWWIYRRHGRHCELKNGVSIRDNVIQILLYLVLSFLLSLLFIIYVF